MAWYPVPKAASPFQGDAPGATLGQIAVQTITAPEAADDDQLKAATATSASVVTNITTFLAQPDVPRAIRLTLGGTAGDIKACNITITGVDAAGDALTENIAITADTAGVYDGAKAFKTVSSVSIPAQDGAGVTVKVGVNEKLGLADKLAFNSVLFTTLNGAKEGTAPTVATSSSVLASNTIDLNSALDGHDVKVYYLLP
ncbi:hypothetical protein M0R72_11760 [Candidatus Pacearchaeota archaeon]|jgi:hypothetical protein|nr:hypothetical protein [Candidatus Pacearchaeota archaeon]